MTFLILFIIFISTILFSIVLERITDSPILVATTIFAIYLIAIAILFVAGITTDLALSILIVIVYAIISYIIALIVRFLECICRNYLTNCCTRCPRKYRN